ncbi:YheC/YheD family endospore coat-associated protein [Robertmurraya korlensis]|uniref:YheC/YheD family endospore coat-associated protein n=1 Tax=Robertmurraya korlensis TaxID=519977 RepID=UPI0008263EB7|nr:YheC/YheD family protein [Robertmurraya korlensis]
MATSYLPITVIPTETFQTQENCIQISRAIANYLNILARPTIFLKIGRECVEVRLEITDIPKNEIHVPLLLVSQFKIPYVATRYLAKFIEESNILLVGPIVALMTDSTETNNLPNFRSVHTFCEELHYHTQQTGGLFYVFKSDDFSIDEISGYYYNEGWKKHIFPPPDVIYNRIHSRLKERSDHFNNIKNEMTKMNIPFFNDRFLSKWDVHALLIEEDHLHPHLPETRLFSEANFLELLNKHSSLFIKPIHGSQGRKILHLYKESHSFIVKVSTGTQSDDFMSFTNVEHFFKWFSRFRRKTTYIIQQGIPLLLYKNRHIDFRVLCHQNHHNSWKVTSVVARISAEKQFVANIARGGETYKPIKALTELFERNVAIQQLALMKELAKEIASIISKNTEGITGELGLDIGVDQDGKLWLIEVNSKPSKNFEEQEIKIRPSTKAIMELARTLAFEYKSKELEENIHADLWIHDIKPEE